MAHKRKKKSSSKKRHRDGKDSYSKKRRRNEEPTSSPCCNAEQLNIPYDIDEDIRSRFENLVNYIVSQL